MNNVTTTDGVKHIVLKTKLAKLKTKFEQAEYIDNGEFSDEFLTIAREYRLAALEYHNYINGKG